MSLIVINVIVKKLLFMLKPYMFVKNVELLLLQSLIVKDLLTKNLQVKFHILLTRELIISTNGLVSSKQKNRLIFRKMYTIKYYVK